MPELPEVEVLVQKLRPLVINKRIRKVEVFRPRVIRPLDAEALQRALVGRSFRNVHRRAKYLLFELSGQTTQRGSRGEVTLIGHLGMTGRMFVQPQSRPLPRHTAVAVHFERQVFVFEDTRLFGRLNLDLAALDSLGPEPLEGGFTPEVLRSRLSGSRQPIKVKLLDQTVVAGVGNIYASEALFHAKIDPRRPARRINLRSAGRLAASIRHVLSEAIHFGSTLPLASDSSERRNDLFYYGQAESSVGRYEERLRVYDRAGEACVECSTPIRRCVQAARSTFWCPRCQPR